MIGRSESRQLFTIEKFRGSSSIDTLTVFWGNLDVEHLGPSEPCQVIYVKG